MGFPGGISGIKNLPANAGDARDTGSTPGSGRFPGVGNGSPLQYSCLENPMDRGAWWVIVHGVSKSGTQLSVCARAHTHTHTHTHTHSAMPYIPMTYSFNNWSLYLLFLFAYFISSLHPLSLWLPPVCSLHL